MRYELAGKPIWLEKLGRAKLDGFALAVLLFCGAVWAAHCAYIGLRHDQLLYVGQVMTHVMPDTIQNDLFFRYGSQDDLTTFSMLFSEVARHFDLQTWPMVALALSQLVFFGAYLAFMKRLMPLPMAAMGLVVLAAEPYYGGFRLISVQENFFTARSLVEPLVMLGLWCIAANRRWVAIIPLTIAASLHPSLALVGWGVWFVSWYFESSSKKTIAMIGLALIALAAIGLSQRAGPLFIDDAWWNSMMPADSMVDPYLWPSAGWAMYFVDVVLLYVASRVAPDKMRLLLLQVLLVCVAMLACALFASETMRLALITQAQLWRCQWLMHVLALGSLPFTLWNLRNRGNLPWLGAAMLIGGFSFPQYDQSTLALICGAVSICCAALFEFSETPTYRFLLRFSVLAILGFTIWMDVDVGAFRAVQNQQFDFVPQLRWLLDRPAVTITAVLGFVVLASNLPRVAVALATASVMFSIFTWDQREPQERVLEAMIAKEHPFTKLIPRGSEVYWPQEFRLGWILLKRPQYYSQAQAAGLIFNRETALEYARRAAIVEDLDAQSDICNKIHRLGQACRPTLDAIQKVCTDPRGPAYFVYEGDILGRAVSKWNPELPGLSGVRFYLYDCKSFPNGEADDGTLIKIKTQ